MELRIATWLGLSPARHYRKRARRAHDARACGFAPCPGQAPASAEISQRAFDHDDGHLRRLVRLEPDAKPDPIDLVDYALDIHYEEVQKDLLLWVLPFCLRAWRDDLRGEDASYAGFVEGLYPALVDGRVLDAILDEDQRAAVALFMRETILEEIDDQAGLSFSGMNARPYRWVYALTAYGVLHPDLEQLWSAWWALGTRGRAVAAVHSRNGALAGGDRRADVPRRSQPSR